MAEAVVAVNSSEIVKAVREITSKYRTKMTLRQIYYRLVARNLIPNNLNSYKNLSRILVSAREKGEIAANIMEDRGRETHGGDYPEDTPEEFIRRRLGNLNGCWNYFSNTMWANQEEYLEVWVEKDALSRLVSSATEPYKVMTCVGRGYSSYTYVSDAVNRFIEKQDKSCTIIYVGDLDPSGLDITRDLGRRLSDYGADHVTVKRIALDHDQVDQYDLPPAPVKLTDARAEKYIAKHGKNVWELDALEPPVLQEIIKTEIASHIDADAWSESIEAIRSGREEIAEKITNVIGVLRDNGIEVE